MEPDRDLLLDDDGVEEGKRLEEESYEYHEANRESRLLDLEEDSAGEKRNRVQHILGRDLIVAVFVVAFDTKKG